MGCWRQLLGEVQVRVLYTKPFSIITEKNKVRLIKSTNQVAYDVKYLLKLNDKNKTYLAWSSSARGLCLVMSCSSYTFSVGKEFHKSRKISLNVYTKNFDTSF